MKTTLSAALALLALAACGSNDTKPTPPPIPVSGPCPEVAEAIKQPGAVTMPELRAKIIECYRNK